MNVDLNNSGDQLIAEENGRYEPPQLPGFIPLVKVSEAPMTMERQQVYTSYPMLQPFEAPVVQAPKKKNEKRLLLKKKLASHKKGLK